MLTASTHIIQFMALRAGMALHLHFTTTTKNTMSACDMEATPEIC